MGVAAPPQATSGVSEKDSGLYKSTVVTSSSEGERPEFSAYGSGLFAEQAHVGTQRLNPNPRPSGQIGR